MTTIAQALTSLGITEWVYRGEKQLQKQSLMKGFVKLLEQIKMVQALKVQTQRTGV